MHHVKQRRSINDIRLYKYMNFNETWPLVALINELGQLCFLAGVKSGLARDWKSGGGQGPSLSEEKNPHSFSSCFCTRFQTYCVIGFTDVCTFKE